MGGPLSVVFANIFMTKLEEDVVRPINPLFYKRFVDDSINRREKNKPGELFNKLNSYHPKIKFTIEITPEKFLDTKIIYENNIQTSVYRSVNKLPNHWNSKVPKKYKRNAINADLFRSMRITSDMEKEITVVKEKFTRAGFPVRFTDSVIRQFDEKRREERDDEMLIPEGFFEEQKKKVFIELPFCPKNEELSKAFLEKFHTFTKNNFHVVLKWKTKKVKQLFKLKSPNPHPACKIYYGECSCGETYIGETVRNVEVRWKEHNSLTSNSEPSKHLQATGSEHEFNWKVLMSASTNNRERKNLEASQIALKRASLNNKLETKLLHLFRNGVT